MNRLHREQQLPLSLEAAWDFFSSPDNLCRITPRWLCFEVCDGPCEPMYAGQILRYRIRPFPQPLSWLQVGWVTEITHVREPFFFVDEQRLGPYRFWHHQHHFSETPQGVLMRDVVHYALPMGPLGSLLDALWVRRRLEEIFDYRFRTLQGMFGAAG